MMRASALASLPARRLAALQRTHAVMPGAGARCAAGVGMAVSRG